MAACRSTDRIFPVLLRDSAHHAPSEENSGGVCLYAVQSPVQRTDIGADRFCHDHGSGIAPYVSEYGGKRKNESEIVMDALILSCGTGGGHNSAGKAILQELERRGHHAEMLNPYSLRSERLSEKIDSTYISTVQHVPDVFGAAYKLGYENGKNARK